MRKRKNIPRRQNVEIKNKKERKKTHSRGCPKRNKEKMKNDIKTKRKNKDKKKKKTGK